MIYELEFAHETKHVTSARSPVNIALVYLSGVPERDEKFFDRTAMGLSDDRIIWKRETLDMTRGIVLSDFKLFRRPHLVCRSYPDGEWALPDFETKIAWCAASGLHTLDLASKFFCRFVYKFVVVEGNLRQIEAAIFLIARSITEPSA